MLSLAIRIFHFILSKDGKAGEFLPCERMFVCHLKLVGDKFPTIRKKFMKRFEKMAPCKSARKVMDKR